MERNLTPIEYLRNFLGITLFVILFIVIIPIIFVLLILTWGKSTNFIITHFAPGIAKPVMWVTGVKFNREIHTDHFGKPAIYIINHSSTLDILTMMAVGVPDIRFVVKWELQYFPFFFLVGRLTGQVFIKRQKSEKAIATLKKTYDRVKRNKLSVMIAPEGSRKHEGVIGPFKKGAFRMAIDLNYPIVPIYFEGNNELSLGGSILARSGSVTAHVHPPIDTSTWKEETLNEHVQEVRALYLNWAGVRKKAPENH